MSYVKWKYKRSIEKNDHFLLKLNLLIAVLLKFINNPFEGGDDDDEFSLLLVLFMLLLVILLLILLLPVPLW